MASGDKSTYCSSRGPTINYQHPHGASVVFWPSQALYTHTNKHIKILVQIKISYLKRKKVSTNTSLIPTENIRTDELLYENDRKLMAHIKSENIPNLSSIFVILPPLKNTAHKIITKTQEGVCQTLCAELIEQCAGCSCVPATPQCRHLAVLQGQDRFPKK